MSVKAGGLARYQLTRKAYENVHEGRGQWYSLRQPRYHYSPWVASCHRRVHIRALVKCMSQVEKTPSGFLHLERRPKKTKKMPGCERAWSGLSVLDFGDGWLHKVFKGPQGLLQG